MSLRARLLLAVGAIALVALVVADVATYSSLRSFLNDRVDQSLDTVRTTVENSQGGRRGGPGGGPPARLVIAQETFLQLRDEAGHVLQTRAAVARNGDESS